MAPVGDRTIPRGRHERLLPTHIRLPGWELGEVQIVPADDGVADQPVASRRRLLLQPLRVEELLAAPEAGRIREPVRVLALVELFLRAYASAWGVWGQ